jgi:hypothetical protein
MKVFILSVLLISSFGIFSQTAWTWTELDTMPLKIANNAVTHGTVSGENYVYSFGGIDTTKLYSGINKNSFRYKVSTDTWEQITDAPFVLTNIASGASTVKNKIYIIGGYHVYASQNEVSSNEVIIYDPETNLYEANGLNIPVPIDDHVQAVWRDSLIYVVTGWSNSANVPDVQIYNPALNTWSVGTDTPNNHDYKAFGTSGTIIGDTIYYFGGAKSSGGFNADAFLRKGVIDQNDPTSIAWTLEENGPNNGYRSACVSHGNNVFWIGGSATSYNYDGIAYNGTGGVAPLTQIMRYQAYYHDWYAGEGAPFSVMDLRGVAQISDTEWIICGGMNENQAVTNRAFLLTYDPVTGGLSSEVKSKVYVYNRQLFSEDIIQSAKLYDLKGRLIETVSNNVIKANVTGLHILKVNSNKGESNIKVIL